MSGMVTRGQYNSEYAKTRTADDLADKDIDATSQATGVKTKIKLGQSPSRPKSSYSVTMRNQKMQNLIVNQEVEQALSEYDNKLFNATVNLENIRRQRAANQAEIWARHTEVVQRKSEQQMQEVVKSLTQYIDHSKHITKRMKAMKEEKQLIAEDRQEIKAERIENVRKRFQKEQDDLEKKKAKIRKNEKEKAKQIQINKNQLA